MRAQGRIFTRVVPHNAAGRTKNTTIDSNAAAFMDMNVRAGDVRRFRGNLLGTTRSSSARAGSNRRLGTRARTRMAPSRVTTMASV